MSRWPKIIVVNVLIVLGMNLACTVLVRYVPRVRSIFSTGRAVGDVRWNLPNYNDKERALLIYQEFAQLKTEYRPFVAWKRRAFQGETTTVDESGDRRHRSPRELGPDAPVARFFGGSTMWGTGADDQGTIPAVFNELHPEYHVFNHGESSHNTRQGIARLVNLYSMAERTDLAIFYDGVNDAGGLCLAGVSLTGHSLETEMTLKMENRQRYTGAIYQLFFKGIVRFFTAILDPEAQPRHFTCKGDPERSRAVARTLVNNWRIAHDLVTARGGTFVAVLQPAAFIGRPNVNHIQRDLDSRWKVLGEQVQAIYPLVRELMRPYAYMYDFSSKYDGDEYIYTDYAHVSRNGNEIVAASIDRLLRERGH